MVTATPRKMQGNIQAGTWKRWKRTAGGVHFDVPRHVSAGEVHLRLLSGVRSAAPIGEERCHELVQANPQEMIAHSHLVRAQVCWAKLVNSFP
mmetsp:Transcript_11457/g.70402  ORF Transcript_11457/g.70402 Transcript_11457/m.70402 type:complete len:93 (+) Transcript_11457:588-866(+)